MSIDYNAIGTWAAVVAVIIAAVSIWVETRRSIYSRGVDILLKYSSEFSSDDFLLRRRQFAQVLKKKLARKLNSKEQKEFVSLATFFLDHYEVVGFLLREKILDRRLTYVYYCNTLFSYWFFFKEVLDAYKDEPTLWEDVPWLYDQFVKMFKKRVPTGVVEMTEEQIKEFIECELS
ncbi:MAG: hypothetical protein HY258_01355 [Chloroflexi bacterium]|nr:hypothetical protein [Chloroflexota bacterium]